MIIQPELEPKSGTCAQSLSLSLPSKHTQHTQTIMLFLNWIPFSLSKLALIFLSYLCIAWRQQEEKFLCRYSNCQVYFYKYFQSWWVNKHILISETSYNVVNLGVFVVLYDQSMNSIDCIVITIFIVNMLRSQSFRSLLTPLIMNVAYTSSLFLNLGQEKAVCRKQIL